MASICKVREKWRALVRRKGYKPICKTFRTKGEAERWARDIESQIDGGKPVGSIPTVGGDLISALIDKYRKLRSSTRPIADTSTEHYTLKKLRATLGKIGVRSLTADDLLGWAKERRDEGAGPYTINMELSRLATVFRYAGSGVPDAIGTARPKLSYLGLIGGGGQRERRPTEDEMATVLTWLAKNKGQQYADFVMFAALSAMRRSEISRIMRDDLDHDKRMVLIRDRKDPRNKAGNDQWIPLLGAAWDLALAQPDMGDGRIFAIHPQTVSKYFTEACREESIPDLHLHDMRHEGISVMFEQGFDIPQVAIVSGHKDWRHLRRYTQIKPESLHLHAPSKPAPGSGPSKQPRPGSHTSASPSPRK